MKKIYTILCAVILTTALFGQDGGQMFTFNFGTKSFVNQKNNGHKTAGAEYLVAGKHLGLALRGNMILRGGDPHAGAGASGKLFFGKNAPSGLYMGAGVDALLTDGRQIMTRGDLGYNLVFDKLALGFEVIAGYDHGYSVSGSGFSASYFGGFFYGGEFKIGWSF